MDPAFDRGVSNEDAMRFGETVLGPRYVRMRWEDLCTNPAVKARELLQFAGCSVDRALEIAALVHKPSSLGRWQTFPEDTRARVEYRGRQWLSLFGYR